MKCYWLLGLEKLKELIYIFAYRVISHMPWLILDTRHDNLVGIQTHLHDAHFEH